MKFNGFLFAEVHVDQCSPFELSTAGTVMNLTSSKAAWNNAKTPNYPSTGSSGNTTAWFLPMSAAAASALVLAGKGR